MKLIRTTLLASLLALSTSAIAQTPPSGPPSSTAPTDAGAISNTTTTTTTTATAPTTTTGIADVAVSETAVLEGEDVDATLANTGGAPLVMSLAGLSLAALAFGVRRKISS